MISVLLIGGEYNGTRTIVENDTFSSIYFKEQKFNYGSNFQFDVKTKQYNIYHIGFNCYIGIHESLTPKQAIELLIKRYPKKRKSRTVFPTMKSLKSSRSF